MKTQHSPDAKFATLSSGILPYAGALRAALGAWHRAGAALPSASVLKTGEWERIADDAVAFSVLRAGGGEPHGFRAGPFGRQLQRALGIDHGPRLLSTESAASFWLNLTLDARAPLLAYGPLETIGVTGRRGEILFLPLGHPEGVETILAVVAPSSIAARATAEPAARDATAADARISA